MARLDAEVKRLKLPAVDARKARDALKTLLAGHEDPRAAQGSGTAVEAQTGSGCGATVDHRRQLRLFRRRGSSGRSADDARGRGRTLTCDALRAAGRRAGRGPNSDALAVDRGRLLETGLEFHDDHGTQTCPVCWARHPDEDWAVAARAALQQEQVPCAGVDGRPAPRLRQARSAVVNSSTTCAPPGAGEPNSPHWPAARSAYTTFADVADDGDRRWPITSQQTLPAAARAYAALHHEAATLIKAREDAWCAGGDGTGRTGCVSPKLAAATDPKLTVAHSEAQKWLQDNAVELRNERIEPLADQARQIWAALRQESNVDLGAIRLVGQKTTRRVHAEGRRRRLGHRGVRGDESRRAAGAGAGDLHPAGHLGGQPVPVRGARRPDPGDGSIQDRRLPPGADRSWPRTGR